MERWMFCHKSTDRLIPVPKELWAEVHHGDCIELHGEVFIPDLIRLRERAVADFGLPEGPVWVRIA